MPIAARDATASHFPLTMLVTDMSDVDDTKGEIGDVSRLDAIDAEFASIRGFVRPTETGQYEDADDFADEDDEERTSFIVLALKQIWGILRVLIVAAAITVLLLFLWIPILQVERSTMAPAYRDGDVVVFITTGKIQTGDVVAFYHGKQVLVKRVIGVPGDWIDIDGDGNVLLNGEPLSEPYIIDRGLGDVTVEFPLQVTERHYFVLSDQRSLTLDSRNADIGLIHQDQLIGQSLLRIWPYERIGIVLN
jgi:signal peptidase I